MPASRASRASKARPPPIIPWRVNQQFRRGDVLSTSEFSQLEYRNAWARFATGVTVITTHEPDGSVHGMTANGVLSVSLDPPLALASIGHNRNSYSLIRASGRFGISILNSGQQDIADHFALPPERRPVPSGVKTHRLGKSTVIAGALAALDCRVIAEHLEGDHTLFIARAEAISYTTAEPLVWLDGKFGRFTPESDAAMDC